MGEIGDVPQMGDTLGLLEHYVDGLAYGRDVCGRHAGTEDQGTGVVLDVIEHGLVAGDETAEGTE